MCARAQGPGLETGYVETKEEDGFTGVLLKEAESRVRLSGGPLASSLAPFLWRRGGNGDPTQADFGGSSR